MSPLLKPADMARRVVGAARAITSRALHPTRRRRAAGSVRGLRPKRIVVLCHGNICRSPFAAAVLDRELKAVGVEAVVESAGFVGPERPSPPAALSVAREFDLDLSHHRSQLILPNVIAGTELFVVMSPQQARDLAWRGVGPATRVVVLGDFDSETVESRSIRDPWNCEEAVFRESYSRIDRCVREMVRSLMSDEG